MPTVTDALNKFRSILGTGENPLGSNENFITAWYGMVGPWCAMTVSWVCNAVGQTAIHYSWCQDGIEHFQSGAWGQWLTAYDLIVPGDIVFYDWGDGGPSDHTGMVESVGAGGSFVALEGNWGDQVSRVPRDRSNVVGFGRPKWTGSAPPVVPSAWLLKPGDTGQHVRDLQNMLNVIRAKAHKSAIAHDGNYGAQTEAAVTEFQTFCNNAYAASGSPTRVKVTGSVDKQTQDLVHWYYVAALTVPTRPTAPSGIPNLKRGTHGDIVRQLQAALNFGTGTKLANTGEFDTDTAHAVANLQRFCKLNADGVYGPKTAAVLAAAIHSHK